MAFLEELLTRSYQMHISDLGFNFQTVIFILFIGLLIALSVTDIKTMEIPPVYNYAIFALGIISIFVTSQIGFVNRIAGALCVSVPLFLIILIVPGGFGGGDIKLMFAAGFFMGFQTTLVSAMIAFILGGIYGVIVLILRKKGRKDHFAFGPFLCAGMIIAIFAKDAILNWYFGLAEGLYHML